MTSTQLRTTKIALAMVGLAGWCGAAALGVAACSRPVASTGVAGPMLGESTAPGPSNPSAPPPDAAGVTEVSARIHGAPTPVANPAPSIDTMPSTTQSPSDPAGTANQSPAVVVTPGVVTGPAPVGAPTTSSNPAGNGVNAAGPNGPGTGNAPAAAGTATQRQPIQTPPVNTPNTDNGPGTGNAPPNARAPAPTTPVAPQTQQPAVPPAQQPASPSTSGG